MGPGIWGKSGGYNDGESSPANQAREANEMKENRTSFFKPAFAWFPGQNSPSPWTGFARWLSSNSITYTNETEECSERSEHGDVGASLRKGCPNEGKWLSDRTN